MIAWGLSVFLGGFFFWYLDIAHCSTLRRWRREIGMPWGIFLELHGCKFCCYTLYLTKYHKLTRVYRVAYHDRPRWLLLHCLGHLASSLPERKAG